MSVSTHEARVAVDPPRRRVRHEVRDGALLMACSLAVSVAGAVLLMLLVELER